MYWVYVLRSKASGRRYVGMTKDLVRRINEHNKGHNKSTKGFIPWELKYKEEFKTRAEARKREKYLKSGIGREFLDKMIK